MLEYKPNLVEAVNRMKSFYRLEEPADRVPAIINLQEPEGDRFDGTFFGGKLEDYLAYKEENFKRASEVMDEKFPHVRPEYGHVLISALCGCKIKTAADTLWSIPFISDMETKEIYMDWDNEWGRRFRNECRKLLERARNKFAVGVYEVEGVSDTIAALCGAENMFCGFSENPEGAYRFSRRITDILIEFGQWNNENIGEKQDILGGVVSGYCFWMPQDSITTTEDHSVMISREYYQSHFKEHTQRLASSFCRTLLEVHWEGAHQYKEFGETEGVDIMTIYQNPYRFDEGYRRDIANMLGKRNFIVYVNPDEIEEVLEFTGTRGIMIVTSADSVKSANEILKRLENV